MILEKYVEMMEYKFGMANLAESSDRNEASDGHQLGAFKQLQFHKSATV